MRVLDLFPGVEFSAVHVPSTFTKLDEAQVKWRITLKFRNQVIESDYQTGLGHLIGYSASKAKTLAGDKMLRSVLAAGKRDAFQMQDGWFPLKLKTPTLDDVMSCLVLDGGAIDYRSFEELASDFGYDTDSRKAEKCYQACLKTGLELRAMFGDDGLSKLKDAFQDY